MVLFTSRGTAAGFAEFRDWAEEQGICLLVQGEDGEFKALMERFTQAPKTVLMGLETLGGLT